MDKHKVLNHIRGGLVVSCQALQNEPLHGSGIMARMAVAAKEGGAVGIRANGASDIAQIKIATGLPIIGIIKSVYQESDVYITPTLKEVDLIVEAGADIVAVDATGRLHPNGVSSERFLSAIKNKYPEIILMADVSTLAEGVQAEKNGADLVSTTLSGYTPYSRQLSGPDFILVRDLVGNVHIPVIAEGRICKPSEARSCIELGSFAVVVGSAITRPQNITRSFVREIKADLYDRCDEWSSG